MPAERLEEVLETSAVQLGFDRLVTIVGTDEEEQLVAMYVLAGPGGAEGERIMSAEVKLGYNHRGIEKAAEARTFLQDVYLLERVCGICSHSHATAFVSAVEEIGKIQVPPRAIHIRTLGDGLPGGLAVRLPRQGPLLRGEVHRLQALVDAAFLGREPGTIEDMLPAPVLLEYLRARTGVLGIQIVQKEPMSRPSPEVAAAVRRLAGAFRAAFLRRRAPGTRPSGSRSRSR